MITLTKEDFEKLLAADRAAGTPGPWHFDGPVWNRSIWTDGENRLCFMAHSNGLNDDRDIANARRITRLPDIEAAYITLAAENATLRASEAAALDRVKVLEAGLADPVSVHANMLRGAIAMPSFANIKHLYAAEFAALTPTADKEPKT